MSLWTAFKRGWLWLADAHVGGGGYDDHDDDHDDDDADDDDFPARRRAYGDEDAAISGPIAFLPPAEHNAYGSAPDYTFGSPGD